jgi:hypothetical protein
MVGCGDGWEGATTEVQPQTRYKETGCGQHLKTGRERHSQGGSRTEPQTEEGLVTQTRWSHRPYIDRRSDHTGPQTKVYGTTAIR